MNKLIYTFLLIFVSCFSFSQDEESDCGLPDDKQVKKLYDNSFDSKKYKEYKKRYLFLKEAVEVDDECVPCYWELAKRSFKRAKYRNLPFKGCYINFKRVAELCPNYHSDLYFYLGYIAYQNHEDSEALGYFKQFKDFKSDDDKKFARDYDEKSRMIDEIIPEIKFNADFFGKEVDFDPKVVLNASSTNDEYLPMISPDQEILFYTRKKEKQHLGDIQANVIEQLTVSHLMGNGLYDDGTALGSPFNDKDKYGGVAISVDNKELYVCMCVENEDNGYNNCDIYMTSYQLIQSEDGEKHYEWSELENLGDNINGETTWEAQPTISPDGQLLLFATARPQSKLMDIYYSRRQEDGEWGPARSVGTKINTAGNDKSPFLHSDGKTLYFSSQVEGDRTGAGGFDLFYSKMDDNGRWTTPKNLGYPINTKADEEGIIVSTDGKKAFFSSGRYDKGVGGKDIYAFELPEEVKPEKVVIVKGDLSNKDGSAVQDAKIKLSFAQSKEVKEIDVKSDDGHYAVAVNMEKDEQVLLSVEKEGHVFSSKLIEKPETTEKNAPPVVANTDITMEKIELGKPFRINDITFETNSSELKPSTHLILTGFADFLKSNPAMQVAIHGHTDDVGSDSDNMVLSEDRAKAVRSFIAELGISESRLSAKGYGETKPKVKNSSDAMRAINRRTEFVIVK